MMAVASRRALPLLIIGAGVVALLLLWALLPGGTGPRDGVRLSGIVEYTVRDASGNLKEHRVARNTDGLQGHTAAMARLFDESTVLASGGNEAFAAIFLTSDATGESSVGAALTTVGANPFNDTSVTLSDPAGTTRRAVIDATFTATGNAAIQQVKLVRAANGTAPTAVAQIFAYQPVTISLTSNDTVTFTWTVDLD